MDWITIDLDLTHEETEKLKNLNSIIINHLEEAFPFSPGILEELSAELTRIVEKNRNFTTALNRIYTSGDHIVIQLSHNENEILNLPWAMAYDPSSQQPLGHINRLNIIKSIPDLSSPNISRELQKIVPPLKILIMISSPIDSDMLRYEEEEFEILKAFEGLMKRGRWKSTLRMTGLLRP